MSLINTKGLIDSVSVAEESGEYRFKLYIQMDLKSLNFSYECCKNGPHIAIDSFAETSLEALQDKNTGVRLGKWGGLGSQFLPIRFNNTAIQ